MFVTLSKQQFESALGELGSPFKEIPLPMCNEYVYDIGTSNKAIFIRIYSTVDKSTGTTRSKGADAIRVVFWDHINDRPVGRSTKILRVEGKTSIIDRIKDRVASFQVSVGEVQIIDFGYVAAILEVNAWSDFAKSMLEQLKQRGSLSDKQLSYVIGEQSPNGKPTMEARILADNPMFATEYITKSASDYETPIKVTPKPEKPSLGAGIPRQMPVIQPPEGPIDLIKTQDYPFWKYPFESFNPVQSQVLPLQAEDKNLVIGANTSAGKTICAEILMDHVLAQKTHNRILYASPLKSLTQEKYSDWQKRFPKEEITILTGDYVLSEEMKTKLSKSRIIVLTSEMLDSRTRRMQTEKNFWLMEIGLVVVDESHILSTSRGHAVEAGIMRFTKLNPKARICFLSATMPNVGELADWLSDMNGKKSSVVYSTWRPVTLQMHFEEYSPVMGAYGRIHYGATQDKKRNLAVKLAMSKPDEKFLIFVHDKGTGRQIVKQLEREKEAAVFHTADLDLADRLEIEGSFRKRDGGLRIMVSTSTTAWGVNLPARIVVIVGVHRGIQEVDQLDIIQMAGRAGRYGIDDEGHVFLIIPDGTTGSWQEIFANPRPVTSVLNQRTILAFHVLAEVMNREIKDVQSLFAWFSRSLAGRQKLTPFEKEDAEGLLRELLAMEMIGAREPETLMFPFITNLGKVSAWLYFSPYDIFAWYSNFRQLAEKKLFHDDLALAWAVADIPSRDMGYVPRDIQGEADELKWSLGNRGIKASDAISAVVAAYHALTAVDSKEEEGVVKGIRRGLSVDAPRMTQALELIDSMHSKLEQPNLWKEIDLRIRYGATRAQLEFIRIKGVGAVKSKKLVQKFAGLEEMVTTEGKAKLRMLFPPMEAARIHTEAKKLVEGGKQG
jgi:replicative superfamily II helicase